jgi:hypothetical protein
LITTLKLGTTQGSGVHQMQASWACGLKGVDRFKKANGAYVKLWSKIVKDLQNSFIPRCQDIGEKCAKKMGMN